MNSLWDKYIGDNDESVQQRRQTSSRSGAVLYSDPVCQFHIKQIRNRVSLETQEAMLDLLTKVPETLPIMKDWNRRLGVLDYDMNLTSTDQNVKSEENPVVGHAEKEEGKSPVNIGDKKRLSPRDTIPLQRRSTEEQRIEFIQNMFFDKKER